MNRRPNIRNIQIGDIEAVVQLEQRCGLTTWEANTYRQLLHQEGVVFGLVMAARGRLVGFVIGRTIAPEMEIYKIAVEPDWQRRGLGRQLLDASLQLGRHQGCERCFLEVRESNRPAQAFYRSQKFKVCGRRTDYYSHPAENAIVMARLLQ